MNITDTAVYGGCSIFYYLWLFAVFCQYIRQFRNINFPLLFRYLSDVAFLHTRQIVKQGISRRLLRPVAVMYQNTFYAQLAAGGCGNRTEIGVCLSGCDNGIVFTGRASPNRYSNGRAPVPGADFI